MIDVDHIDRPSDEPITQTGGQMNRMTMHRRIAAALAAALMFAAAAPAADARWFNVNGNGSLVLVTPQAWALEAYRELLGGGPHTQPNLAVVWTACGVLTLFGGTFIALAWWLLRLD